MEGGRRVERQGTPLVKKSKAATSWGRTGSAGYSFCGHSAVQYDGRTGARTESVHVKCSREHRKNTIIFFQKINFSNNFYNFFQKINFSNNFYNFFQKIIFSNNFCLQ